MTTARLVAEHPGMDVDRALAPSALGAVPRFRSVGGVVERLDPLLCTMASRPSALGPGMRLLAASPDLATVVGASDAELTLAVGDDVVRRIPVERADSAVLVGHDRLLVTGPLDGPHRIALVDLATGGILDETVVDAHEARVTATLHPTDGSVVLDAGEGQDGSRVFVVRLTGDDDGLEVDERAGNVAVAGFDSTGRRLLLTPHPSFEPRVAVVAWPSLDVLAAATHDDLGREFDFYGCFVDDDRILLRTYDDEVIVCDDGLTAATRVAFDPPGRFAGAEVSSIRATGPGLFAAGLWRGGQLPATVWSLDR